MIIDRPYLKDLVMLFLASYIFLLRLPSEGLPLAAHEAPAGVHDPVPVLSVTECEIVVDFPFRKNRLHPSRQVRACWCKHCKLTCPIHVLGKYMAAQGSGSQPFVHIRSAQALLALRELLLELNVPDALCYGTHGFRRGHAEDLLQAGGRLGDILAAGDWRSAAFLDYLNKERLVRDRIAEAHAAVTASDSSSDEEHT